MSLSLTGSKDSRSPFCELRKRWHVALIVALFVASPVKARRLSSVARPSSLSTCKATFAAVFIFYRESPPVWYFVCMVFMRYPKWAILSFKITMDSVIRNAWPRVLSAAESNIAKHKSCAVRIRGFLLHFRHHQRIRERLHL